MTTMSQIPASYELAHFIRGCLRKTRFPTLEAAERRIRRMRNAGADDGGRLNAYHCVHCFGFHVGKAYPMGVA